MQPSLQYIMQSVLRAFLILAPLVTMSAAGFASTSPGEARIYEVRVDDKPAGNYKLQLRPTQSGIDVVSHCEVDFRVLFYHYRYRYDGHEVWKGDSLTSLGSDCQDGGKQIHIQIQPNAQTLKLTVNGKSSPLSADTLTSSYWRLPTDRSPSGQFVEVDSGRIFQARLEQQGVEPVQSGDRTQQCRHYRLSGGDSGDLWYDQQNRLVRQISETDGHKTLVQLKQIDRI